MLDGMTTMGPAITVNIQPTRAKQQLRACFFSLIQGQNSVRSMRTQSSSSLRTELTRVLTGSTRISFAA